MQKQETLSYADQYKDAVIPCSPFVFRSTGLVQSLTSLKVETYNLACVPYQFSMSRAALLGAFSKDEVAYFQRFTNALAALSLTVQGGNDREPSKIFCRCQISAFGTMKGRDRVGLVLCDFKPIPPSLETILGEHLMRLDRLRMEWNDLRGKSVPITPDSARKMGFNNYASAASGSEQFKLALFSLAVDQVDFLMPLRSPDMRVGTVMVFNLFFQKYRFSVNGTIASTQRLPSGVQKVRATLEFSPELTDLLNDYFFQARVLAKRGQESI
ncbi:MAG TPA: hypothetical protein VMV90_06640 [Rectinemataceae bacterium]|nr:hypothetical protein [Rectinemataceae bacterium]